MDATQSICDSHLESDEEESEEESENNRGHPLAKLCILKNEHIPEAEFPLFLGDNVLGRDPSTCNLPLLAPSVSKQHVTISLSVYRTRGHQSEVEALVWDHGSLNGTRKGRLKLTSNVRYALSEGDSLVLADIPCQYVTCAADTLSSQRDLRSPVNRNSGVKNRLPDASREHSSGSVIGSKTCVNGSTKASTPLPDLEDVRRTPAKTSCLSFEQTPSQPQGALVPDSDSDSDGERRTGRDRRRNILVSDSDSCKSGPTCSTFLSPTNKIVPESEDESSITPPSSTKNRPCRHVSFSMEETDMNVARQQLKEKKSLVIMGDSEEEEGSKEERATPGTKPDKSGQPIPVNKESSASLTVGDKLLVFTPALSTDVIAPFNMDSDTDVEEEEERVAVASVTLNTNKQHDQPPSAVQFNMDSDTDVDEDSDASVSGPKSALLSDDSTKPPVHVIRPKGISMDSDTDVDDDGDNDNVSKAAKTAKPTSSQAAHSANSALVIQPEDVHLDSDTDVDEDEEKACGTNVTHSTTSETSAGLDLGPTGPESKPVVPHTLHLDSDTDDEGIPGPALSEQLVGSDVTHTSAAAGADLGVLSNCHTDMENESLLVVPVANTARSATSAAATQSDSDADTDVDESSMPPAGNGNSPADLRLNSDVDVEDREAGADLCREQTPLLPVLQLQKCSTPVQQSEGEVEELETQAFASPSSGPFRYPQPGRPAFSLSSDSQEEEDFTVAETQSFILQHRDHQKCPSDDPVQTSGLESSVNKKDGSSNTGRTFQLELSDSSHQQCQAQALATDSTQPFGVTGDGGVNFEETQPYADIMTADQTSGENKSYLEATQAYGGEIGCSVGTEKELHVDLALQATQAYIPEPYSDAEEETADETQPADPSISSTLAMAETQLMPVPVVEHSPTEDDPLSSVPQFATKEKEEQGEGAPREQRQSEVLSVAETQPVSISNYEENGDEDSLPVLRKRKAKQLRPEEETQTSVNSDLSVAETQPMCIGNYAQSDDEDSLPTLRKRKAKQLSTEEETQTTVNSDLSFAETQPMCLNRYDESDDEESFPGPRKRKAKPLQHKDEDTQSLTNSEVSAIHALPVETKPCVQLQEEQVSQSEAGVSGVNKEDTHRVVNPVAETQPMCISNYEESEDEDSLPILRKRKAKQLQPAEDETQALVTPELSVAETQPIDTGENGESDEDSILGHRKRKAKPLQHKDEDTQTLSNSQASAIDSQPIETKSCEQLQKGKARQSEAGPSGVSEEDTNRVVNPVAETQPMCISNYNEGNAEDSERKAKQLLAEEEETQAVVTPELPADEVQPMGTNEDVEGHDEDSISGPRKRKAKLGSDASASNTQNQTKDSLQQQRNEEMQSETGTSGVSVRNRRGARARVREDEEEQAECPEPPKRQTRGKRKALLSPGKALLGFPCPDDDETEEEEEAEQATGANSKRYKKGKEKRKLVDEQERKEREEEGRLKVEEERAEKERLEKERKKQEEKEIADRIQKDKEQLEREREEKERLDREERVREQKEQEEKDRLEMAKRAEEEQKRLEERKEQETQARLEMQETERLEKLKLNESHENKEDVISETPDRGRRATRRTAAVSSTTESQQESSNSTTDDCPARRTRSRSNSSNSVSSERSASSANTQENRGRGRGKGRGRGVTRTSELLQKTTVRSSNRRRTVATEPSAQREITEWVSNDIPSPGVLSRSNSSNSLNSEISSCSVNSQSRGRGGRQRGRGRGRKIDTEPDSVPPISSQSDQQSVPRVTARSRKSRASELPPNQDEITRTNAQQPGTTTRGRRRACVNHSEPAEADEKDQPNPEKGSGSAPSLLPQGNDRRKQKTETCEAVETPRVPSFSDGSDAEEKRRGRKRDLETDAEEGSSSKTSRGKIKVQKTDEKTEKKVGTTTEHGKKNANESGEEVERKEDSKKVDQEVVEKKARGPSSRVQSKRKEKQEESGMDTDAEAQQSQTPPRSVSRKRQLATLDSSPVVKTPRSSSASPATTGRSRAASQGFKVLFTGVVDDEGEKVLPRLGGSMAETVADMNCLVTDKVRRTVKFLCAVAKGVPIVTTQWLEKSGKAGTFLSPSAYVVKDPEQENKFNFCLQESLRIASSQPLLQGYEIHVTKSVKPEPVHMKDIISCSRATFLPKMPSSHKPQTVVVSCEEDWPLCGPAVKASIPVVTAEFILTGILQQKVDFETHKLSGPATTLQPAGGRGRGRKKT